MMVINTIVPLSKTNWNHSHEGKI